MVAVLFLFGVILLVSLMTIVTAVVRKKRRDRILAPYQAAAESHQPR